MSTALSYYFNEEHESFRKTIRQFLETEAIPNIDQWELEGKIPREFWKKFGEMGYFGLCYPESLGGSGLDFFYDVIMLEEISKIFSGGFAIGAELRLEAKCQFVAADCVAQLAFDVQPFGCRLVHVLGIELVIVAPR